MLLGPLHARLMSQPGGLMRQVGTQLSQRQVLRVSHLLQLTQLAVQACYLSVNSWPGSETLPLACTH